MMWFSFALFSAVLKGVRRTGEKRLLVDLDHIMLGWIMQLVQLPLFAIILIVSGKLTNPFTFGSSFWLPVIINSCVFYPLNTVLFYRALKQGELTAVLPIQSIGPVVSLVLALLILGEIPSVIAVIGIVIIVFGLYALNLNGSKMHNPLRPFLEDRSTLYMLGSTVIVALEAPIDKIGIQASNVLAYTVAVTLGGVITLFAVIVMTTRSLPKLPRAHLPSIMSMGILQGASYIMSNVALSTGPAAYVNAVKSAGALVSSLGGIIFFHERVTRHKLMALGIIGLGIGLLAIST